MPAIRPALGRRLLYCLGAVALTACSHAPVDRGAAAPAVAEVNPAAMLAAHNQWRARVGVGPMRYSAALAASSQAWADELRRSNQCRMRHSAGNGQIGENLFWASAGVWSSGRRELQQVSDAKVVDSWGSEQRDYDYASNRCAAGKVCGHYTQVVWQQSTEVGCAVAVCADSLEQVWVCQYQPAGNIVGRPPY